TQTIDVADLELDLYLARSLELLLGEHVTVLERRQRNDAVGLDLADDGDVHRVDRPQHDAGDRLSPRSLRRGGESRDRDAGCHLRPGQADAGFVQHDYG